MVASLNKHQKALAILLLLRIRRRRRRNRTVWVRSWLERRRRQGVYSNLARELRIEDPEMYRRYFRVTSTEFEEILCRVAPVIKRADTIMRPSIPPAERLAVTLRFLATGETFCSLAFAYRIGERTISNIVTETCQAIYKCLKDDFLKVPSTKEEWLEISDEFAERWNYPFCLGALDGKHIALRQPPNSGSEFFNYKHFFSVVLLALVDANYKFIFLDVGSTGRSGDAGIFERSTLKAAMDSNSLSIPPAGIINGVECCYHIVGDDAFALRTDIMKPYPYRNMTVEERIFNYRLSRARRVVENAFGILANRFRVFLTTICLNADKVEKIVLATCCLHNFLLTSQQIPTGTVDQEDEDHQLIPGSWRDQPLLQGLKGTQSRNYSACAKTQRDALKAYFSSEAGRVPWQYNMI